MLLTVLVYADAMGQRSSRRIERLCRTDVAFVIAYGRDAPDHTTIARFRQDHQDAVTDLFTQVLVLGTRLGLVRKMLADIDAERQAAQATDAARSAANGQAYLAVMTDPGASPAQRKSAGMPPAGTDLVALAQARLDRAITHAQAAWDRYQRRVQAAAAQGRRPPGRPGVRVEDHR